MKALSLWQPWASLIPFGIKGPETRAWSTTYRGPLAIHATARIPMRRDRPLEVGDFEVVQDNPRGAPPAYLLRGPIGWPYRLPLAAVVAKGNLVECVPTHEITWIPADEEMHFALRSGRMRLHVPIRYRPYGDYSPNRYAWVLEDIERVREVPARGRQGLWEWEPAAA